MDYVKNIKTSKEISPKIYAYITPGNISNKGWVKIGYTDRDVHQRIKEQTHTANVEYEVLWSHEARFEGGTYFKDYQFHSFLTRNRIERKPGTEWFKFDDDLENAEKLFFDFIFGRKTAYGNIEGTQYKLRDEQEEAVSIALEYFSKNENGEFLWNAKPRFGKTLASYDLARRLNAYNVLIITNRPAIANSWYDDYEQFIEWQTDYKFVSDSSSLKDRPVFSREQYRQEVVRVDGDIRQIAFLSLQDLKGSIYFGGHHKKLEWVADSNWDLLIIDEAHEAIDTFKTDIAFNKIKRKHTLHLSGTPFKQIANEKFSKEAIYNWSYTDEQEAKQKWNGDTFNPYQNLPKLNMFTYQMSNMILGEMKEASSVDEKQDIDFAFDLNEFFKTKDNGDFEHEKEIIKWLDTLTDNEKYPFSTKELRNQLKHTFWLLNRVDSAKALAKLLKNHKVFENYEIIVAAGDGKEEFMDNRKNEESLTRVRNAIKTSDKTITLSVGQLTTGVTVPEWTAVLMLSNLKSPALYMQAAFRAQNPYQWIEKDSRGIESLYEKKNAYIFDFAPERTLQIVDDFANNLSTSLNNNNHSDKVKNIKRLLNFFPVIGEDSEGKMVELDATQVLTIPKNIKAKEVVRRGFMSNLLFNNVSGIFRATKAVTDILNNLEVTDVGNNKKKSQDDLKHTDLNKTVLDDNDDVVVNEIVINEQAEKIFGEKNYEIEEVITAHNIDDKDYSKSIAKELVENFADTGAFEELASTYDMSKREANKTKKIFEDKVEELAKSVKVDLDAEKARLENEYTEKCKYIDTQEELKNLNEEFENKLYDTTEKTLKKLVEIVKETDAEYKTEVIVKQEKKIKEKEKKVNEENVRSRLRGFSRTIPSFIMAYGDENLTLMNFEHYTPEDVFKEVTGITMDQFLFLRDGGDSEENGETKYFEGHLFNEIVFNESIQEFLKKRKELGNYFEEKEEDIFDYIPNQKTNQIFTPKWVVKMMVQQLEDENPGIFDDSSKTFIDLYMKSGLYITEIVKKLYNSEKIKNEFPNDEERIKHILENQVYGLAPTNIIYKIATNFIFGNYSDQFSQKHFKMLDAYPYAENGTLDKKLDEIFS
ncbi:DEAD/DEAH box helicase family protein [Macrococcus equi]|uniref:DEAD/DEAH box helicase family protein n=1 Tax=Macrococcus equi TaxID=3395462 RepID=UPI0039BDB22A